MPDLGTLNPMLTTLIAMVIVILVLSLVVQSVQTLIKKLLKFKSHSIHNSLQDLFETVTNRPSTPPPADTQFNLRGVLDFFKNRFQKMRKKPAAPADTPDTELKTPQQLVVAVTDRLKDMGRKSLFGHAMLDSLAKGDLLKVLTRVKAEDLLPGAVGNFQAVLAGIQKLKDEMKKIDTTKLPGETSAKFAAMKGLIMPLINDLESLASGGNIDPAVFFGDLYKVRQIKAAEVLDILGQIQQGVSHDLAAAQTAGDESRKALAAAQAANNEEQIKSARDRDDVITGNLVALRALDEGLKKIADLIAKLSHEFDTAFAPLFVRLQQVEVWYDTVMQGFQERYARHMKTVGIFVSLAVVMILNANIFSVYRAIKADPVKTAAMVEQFEATQKANREKTKKAAEATEPRAAANIPSPSSASASPTASASVASAAATPAAGSPTPTQVAQASPQTTPAAAETPESTAEVKAEVAKVNELAKTYESFGLRPLSGQQLSDVWHGNVNAKDITETLLGWAIMVMLLSAGAPFWEDTLESLFGLKGLIRQKSDTKNIEEEKGGQPKP